MRRAARRALAVLPLLACPAMGGAAEVTLGLAPVRDGRLVWYYNHTGAPPAVTSDRVLEAIEYATRAWASCGVIFEYGGPTTAAPGIRDDRSTLGWSRSLYNALRDGDAGGVTLGWVEAGRAVEVDILLTPQTVRTVVELRLVVAHEIGHALGLTHTLQPGFLMSASGSPEEVDAHPRPSRAELERCRSLYRS